MKNAILGVSAFVLLAAFGSTNTAQAAFDALCSPDYDGQYFDSKPEISDDFCETGGPSQTIEGDGSQATPWKWHCFDDEGNQGKRCEAFQGTPAVCGNGIIEGAEQCDGHEDCSDTCEMTATCNAAINGQEVASEPETSLCSVGTQSSSIEGSGTDADPWTWGCYDVAGNKDDTCSAVLAPVVEASGEVLPVEDVVVPEVEVPTDTVEVTPVESTEVEVVAAAGSASAPQGVCAVADYSDIKGTIWYDDNQDGSENGEDGIEDVTVELFDEDGNELDEDKTDEDGDFKFENLAPGKYIVDVKESDDDLEGYFQVYESDNNLNGRDQVRVKCDDNRSSVDFGYDDEPLHTQGRPSTLSQTGGYIMSRIIGWLF